MGEGELRSLRPDRPSSYQQPTRPLRCLVFPLPMNNPG